MSAAQRFMQRLKTRPQFQAVLNAVLVAKTHHFAFHRLDSGLATGCEGPMFPSGTSWIGAMAPKRWAKRAVTRNTIKRQIYASSSGLGLLFRSAACLIRLRNEFSRQDYPSASSDALKQAIRAELIELIQAAAASNKPAGAPI